jgi:ubiquitin C-terminal hydrolase
MPLTKQALATRSKDLYDRLHPQLLQIAQEASNLKKISRNSYQRFANFLSADFPHGAWHRAPFGVARSCNLARRFDAILYTHLMGSQALAERLRDMYAYINDIFAQYNAADPQFAQFTRTIERLRSFHEIECKSCDLPECITYRANMAQLFELPDFPCRHTVPKGDVRLPDREILESRQLEPTVLVEEHSLPHLQTASYTSKRSPWRDRLEPAFSPAQLDGKEANLAERAHILWTSGDFQGDFTARRVLLGVQCLVRARGQAADVPDLPFLIRDGWEHGLSRLRENGEDINVQRKWTARYTISWWDWAETGALAQPPRDLPVEDVPGTGDEASLHDPLFQQDDQPPPVPGDEDSSNGDNQYGDGGSRTCSLGDWSGSDSEDASVAQNGLDLPGEGIRPEDFTSDDYSDTDDVQVIASRDDLTLGADVSPSLPSSESAVCRPPLDDPVEEIAQLTRELTIPAHQPPPLPNFGATCFVNAALQVLFSIEPFRVLLVLVHNLFSGKSSHPPLWFACHTILFADEGSRRQVLRDFPARFDPPKSKTDDKAKPDDKAKSDDKANEKAPSREPFSDGKARDLHEFLVALLNGLEAELENACKIEGLMAFLDPSVFTRLFFGTDQRTSSGHKHPFDKIQGPFWIVELHIPQPKAAVTLDECFNSFVHPPPEDPDNWPYCPVCRAKVEVQVTVHISRPPRFMVIHLNRVKPVPGKTPDEYTEVTSNAAVTFPDSLNMDAGVLAAGLRPASYKLICWVDHIASTTHYIANVRQGKDVTIKCNDAEVTKTQSLKPPVSHMSQGVYLLVYEAS